MLFVKSENLKVGMRLARPIYNRDGVLLYERDSKLSMQGIVSIANFGLIGIYVLEPAEPVPPMTQDDIAFERFQTMMVFALKEELTEILKHGLAQKSREIADMVIKNYGNLNRKINFIQNLRSNDDYIFKHSLNVSILCALMSKVLGLRIGEQRDVVMAGLVHDIGKLAISNTIKSKGAPAEEDAERLRIAEKTGYEVIGKAFPHNPDVKRLSAQSNALQECLQKWNRGAVEGAFIGAKILAVAETFDTMTAMRYEKDPESEVATLRFMMEQDNIFDPDVVNALIEAIHILSPGTCIELNNNEKGLVLVENENDFLQPVILTFSDNKVIDLSSRKVNRHLEIKDIMKTLDNRYVMDMKTLKESGYFSEKPKYKYVDGVDSDKPEKKKENDANQDDINREDSAQNQDAGYLNNDLGEEEYEEYVPGRDF